MRILVFSSNTFFLDPIIIEWQKLGIEVDIVKIKIRQGTSLQMLRKSLYNRIIKQLLRFKVNKYDLIWCEWAEDALKLLSIKPKPPVFLRIHSPLLDLMKNLEFDKINGVISVSTTTQRDIAKYTKSNVIPNALRHEFYLNNIERDYNISKICSVGNPMGFKRMYDIFLSVRKAREMLNHEFELTIVGNTLGNELAVIKKLAENYSWFHHIEKIEGMKGFFQTQDMFISNSIYESFALSLVEACSQGIIPLHHALLVEKTVLPETMFYFEEPEELLEKIKFFHELNKSEGNKLIIDLIEYSKNFHPEKIATDLIQFVNQNI